MDFKIILFTLLAQDDRECFQLSDRLNGDNFIQVVSTQENNSYNSTNVALNNLAESQQKDIPKVRNCFDKNKNINYFEVTKMHNNT